MTLITSDSRPSGAYHLGLGSQGQAVPPELERFGSYGSGGGGNFRSRGGGKGKGGGGGYGGGGMTGSNSAPMGQRRY